MNLFKLLTIFLLSLWKKSEEQLVDMLTLKQNNTYYEYAGVLSLSHNNISEFHIMKTQKIECLMIKTGMES